MPAVKDFRESPFSLSLVTSAGRNVGRTVYWRLYAIENVFRVIIHTVLSGQVGTDWWTQAVDPDTQKTAERFRKRYVSQPWHSAPGTHEIYYLGLPDLNEVMRANSNLFLPVIPTIDQWIARLEQIRLPRNIVAHMNWPHKADRNRINLLYADLKAFVNALSANLALTVPQ